MFNLTKDGDSLSISSRPTVIAIDGLTLTHREIDITACMLSGRSAKKIASFLSISSKTVESHIRNIMLKIGCRSQEAIIDFIEKSGKLHLFKNYYSNLLTNSNFENQLIKIAAIEKEEKTQCLLFYPQLETKAIDFNKFKEHLFLSGHDVLMQSYDEPRNVFNTTKKFIDKYPGINHIIVAISVPLLNSENNRTEIPSEAIGSIEEYSKLNAKSPIFLFVSQEASRVEIPAISNSSVSHPVYLTQEKSSYYHCIFAILQKINPKANIQCLLQEFLKTSGLHDKTDNVLLMSGPRKEPDLGKQNTPNRFIQNFLLHLIDRKALLICGLSFILGVGAFILFFNTKQDKIYGEQYKVYGAKSGKEVSFNLPRHDQIFIGRDKLLKNLNEKLYIDINSVQKKPHELSVVACAGLGGVGKTQIALQYLHNTQHRYTLKIWFPADNIHQLQQKYLEFAKNLGYMSARVNIEESIAYVKNWLQDHPGWLLVLDNVEQYEDIVPFLPDSGGNILITTRNTRWPNKIEVLPIHIMEPDEAIELVKKLSGRNEPEIEALTSLLGRLPLALAQASAYIREKNKTVAQYLEFYKYYEQKLLSDETLPAGSNHAPVMVTWDTNLSAIESELKKKHKPALAKSLLTACAYLSSEDIPMSFLLTWLQNVYPSIDTPDLLLDELLRQLMQYSLITLNAEKQTISLHRLLQSVLRHQDKLHKDSPSLVEKPNYSQEWFCDLSNALDQVFWNKDTSEKITYQQLALLPHLQTLENYYHNIAQKPSMKTLAAQSKLLSNIGYAFQYILGESGLAKTYYERALVLNEQHYGKDHIEVANTLTHLGYAYRCLGDAKKAKDLLERALMIKERDYGHNDFEVVSTLTILGSSYRDLGNPKHSEKLLERAMLIIEKQQGNNNANIDNILAKLSVELKTSAGTEDQNDYLWHSLVNDHGKNAIEEADTLTFLGNAYRASGNIPKARDALENALKIREKFYGLDHFSTALTLTYLGNVYRDLGDTKRAKDLLERALAIREKHYGKNHFEVANTKTYLAMVYRLLGYPQKSKQLCEEALAIKEQHYGKDHYEVSLTLNIMATAYRILGELNGARELLERSLMIREKFYGKNNFETAIALHHLGTVYYELGNLEHAKRLLERALNIRELHYGKSGHEVALTLNNLARVYAKSGELNHAKALLERALDINEKFYGKSNFQTAFTMNSLGKICFDLGETLLAKQLLERVLAINLEYFANEKHFELASTMSYLAEVHKSLNNTKESERYQKRLMKICDANQDMKLRFCIK